MGGCLRKAQTAPSRIRQAPLALSVTEAPPDLPVSGPRMAPWEGPGLGASLLPGQGLLCLLLPC